MKISILIPMYNSSNYIEATILSALNQTWKNKEIIIVDDGSTDESYEIAKTFESDILKVYKQLHKGAPKARNFAFEKSTGEYIQFLDADDLLAPNKIENQLKKLKEFSFDPDIVAFCAWIEFKDEENIIELKKRKINLYKDFEPAYHALIEYWKISFPSIPYHNYLTHRKKIEEVGIWREDLTNNQDSEYFARVICNCKKLIYCNDTIVYYRDVCGSVNKINSKEKIHSELIANKEITQQILAHTLSEDAIKACSLRYTEFIESRYPLNKEYLKEAFEQMKIYKLNFITSHRGYSYKILYTLFGWKIAGYLLRPYNRIKELLAR